MLRGGGSRPHAGAGPRWKGRGLRGRAAAQGGLWRPSVTHAAAWEAAAEAAAAVAAGAAGRAGARGLRRVRAASLRRSLAFQPTVEPGLPRRTGEARSRSRLARGRGALHGGVGALGAGVSGGGRPAFRSLRPGTL